MDKELLRMVIIGTGACVILIMLVWGLFKNKKKRREINFYDDHDPFDNIDSRLIMNVDDDDFDIISLQPDSDDFDVVPLGKQHAEEQVPTLDPKKSYEPPVREKSPTPELKTRLNPEYVKKARQATEDVTSPPIVKEVIMPTLLQFSLLANEGEVFTGPQLLEAFDYVGLVFGSVQVFERLDDKNRVDYAVASMMGQGTFPKEHWETYHCPGIKFFMQPREVEDAPTVFNELVNTLGQLSALLHGDILDADNQPLTEATVNKLESSLK